MINSKLLRLKKKENSDKCKNTDLITINGVKKTKGCTTMKIKIFDIEKKIDVYVVDGKSFKYNFLIGLDIIKEFNLIQNENLEVKQKLEKTLPNNPNMQLCLKNNLNEDRKRMNNNIINFNEHVIEKDFIMDLSHLNSQQKFEINKLIDKYKSCFARDKYDIGTVKDYEAHIDLLVDKYCSKRPYRCSMEDKLEIEGQVRKLLEKNLIEESYSPFAAPVTLAFKKEDNKKTRLCIDFRDLNKVVVPQAQPFPLIEDLVMKTRNCKYFSTLDINSAFWSIPLRIEDRKKTAFVTQEGHYQWTCLPFGLKTSPAIFQRILSNILRGYKLTDFAVNFIDDILIFSKSYSDHIHHLSQLLEAIKREGFRLKFTKCRFATNSVKYLGHIIQDNTVRPVRDNLISIRDFPTPRNQKNIRQLLGKINFYREYIPNSSIILEPLHNLLRKNQQFLWSKDCQEAFEKIKQLLCTQPILEIFDQSLPINIYTDASLEGIGAVLKQIQPNKKEKPVAYFSKKLNEVQKKKKAIYLECLAIKEAIKYWHYWLIGKYFTVYSDHKPLENLNIKSRVDEELGELSYYLSQYNFEIKYAPGKDNLEADCLSRNPVLEANKDIHEQLKIINLITLNDILADQEKNENIQQYKKNLLYKNKIYYKRIKKQEKILLSEEFSIKFIKLIHENMCHIGIKQMQRKIGNLYTAKNLTRNITDLCKHCEICIKNKTRRQTKYGLMSYLGPATKPFEIVSIDTIGGLGGSRSTKKYLHLLVDHFSRYAYIVTSKTQSAKDFIKIIKNVPNSNEIGTVLTDQYPGINSKEFKTFLSEKSITLIFTAVNSPFSNGLNERLNQTLINKIRCKINEKPNNIAWTTIAHNCVERYNNTEHSITGFAPKYLLDGTDVSLIPNELKLEKATDDWIKDREIALERTIKSHEYNKNIIDKNRTNHNFKTGDMVYVENGNRLNRKKLDEIRIGPFTIEEKLSQSIYKVNTGHRKMESNLFHVTKLIPVLTP